MIFTQTATGTRLAVRQPDHARTCRSAAEAWQRPGTWPQDIWNRFVQAVGRHDNGWIDAEREPALAPDGRPHDFKSIPTARHVSIWRQTIDLAARDDPYQGLVVALHARWLYTNLSVNHDDKPAAGRFINEATRRIDDAISHIRDGGRSEEREAVAPTNLKQAQSLLTFFDALSLMLLGAIPWRPVTQPVCFGDLCGGLNLTRARDNPDHIQTTPWPFVPEQVELHTRAYPLPDIIFQSPAEVSAQLADAPAIDLRWVLIPAADRA